MSRIRLYQSALNNVRYAYGRALKFNSNPKVVAEREALRDAVVAASKSVES